MGITYQALVTDVLRIEQRSCPLWGSLVIRRHKMPFGLVIAKATLPLRAPLRKAKIPESELSVKQNTNAFFGISSELKG